MKKKSKVSQLNERCRVKRKELKTLIEELKQKMLAKGAKVRRYEKRIEQFRQSRNFDFNQQKIYAKLIVGKTK